MEREAVGRAAVLSHLGEMRLVDLLLNVGLLLVALCRKDAPYDINPRSMRHARTMQPLVQQATATSNAMSAPGCSSPCESPRAPVRCRACACISEHALRYAGMLSMRARHMCAHANTEQRRTHARAQTQPLALAQTRAMISLAWHNDLAIVQCSRASYRMPYVCHAVCCLCHVRCMSDAARRCVLARACDACCMGCMDSSARHGL